MKKVLLLFIIISSLSSVANAQIEIDKGFNEIASVTMGNRKIVELDDIYYFCFRDARYPSLSEYFFIEIGDKEQTIDLLNNLLEAFSVVPNGKSATVNGISIVKGSGHIRIYGSGKDENAYSGLEKGQIKNFIKKMNNQ
ncbi:MAG: hypothetical protein LUH10_00440 [Tannerellaceae bacterium]|nr:hypothetical protein [Tannerellaceae bacterium]